MRQLTNTDYYEPLDTPMYPDTAEKLKEQLIALKRNGHITSKQLSYLQPDVNKMSSRYFYLLPKVHKPRDKWPHPNMPAGRPIVSDCASESSKICAFIDYFLQPVANLHESYIQDTYHFINKIRGQVIEPDWLLISADVESLYTNMRIDLILESIREIFLEFPDLHRPDEGVLGLLETTLRCNDFEFNGSYFLQICGIAMGRKYSPSAANIYLRRFDQKAMHEFPIQPKLYSRFLDDIFAIWPGTRAQLTQYQEFLNSLIPGIRVTFAVRDQIIEFLDTMVYKAQNDQGQCVLQTKVYFKPTDTHQLLHRTSFHPAHTFKGIVKSQFIRFKRISSTYTDFADACHTLVKVLLTRGYNARELQKLKSEVWHKYADRPNRDLEQQAKKDIIPVVTHYDNFHARLNKRWCRVIRSNPVFDTVRVISAYKRHKNLADLLVRGRLGRPNAVTNHPSQDEDEDQRVEAMLDALIEVINRDNLSPPHASQA